MERTKEQPLHKEQGKDKLKPTQQQTIFHYLKCHIATNTMVSMATGIPQKNICRYKRDMEKAGILWEIEKKPCKVTGFRAWYLTTDEDKAPNAHQQLNLFQR